MITLTKSAYIYSADGYLQDKNVTVIDHGDTISFGKSLHLKDELTIEDMEITHRSGWTAKWNPPHRPASEDGEKLKSSNIVLRTESPRKAAYVKAAKAQEETLSAWIIRLADQECERLGIDLPKP